MFSYRSSFIKAKAYCSNPSKFLNKKYDLALLVSGWEQRCTAITHADIKILNAGLISFEHNLDYLKYNTLLINYLKEKSNSLEVIFGHINDLENVSGKILNFINKVFLKKGRPIKILIDITCCPKYYFLFILAHCFKNSICSEIDFTYAEGIYSHTHKKKYIFTHGEWNPIVIPGFEGIVDPQKKRFFLVSLGFEGDKALRMISRYEPDRLSVLLSAPGFSKEYTTEALKNTQPLIEEYRIPQQQIIEAHAGNAIQAWKELEISNIERPDTEEITYLCFGTKPHSLGLGLRALLKPEIKIIYNKPERYEIRDVRFNNRFWIYNIVDLSSI